ncbi:Hypothetical protein (plasmid) [Pseudomonas putida]|nr:Hypothetical protein [Pseudomonas putida]
MASRSLAELAARCFNPEMRGCWQLQMEGEFWMVVARKI